MRPVIIDDKFLLAIRQAALAVADAIEVLLGMKKTSEIRREWQELTGKK